MANNKDFKVKNGIQPTVYNEGVGTVVSGFVGYYLTGASYDNISLSISANETDLTDGVMGDSGTKLYVIGSVNDTVYQYNLSTANDLSTATYANKSFSVASQTNDGRDIQFKTDGTKMYILDRVSSGTIYQYSLSTAWDVSTASYDNVAVSFGADSVTDCFVFKPDGTKGFVCGTAFSSLVYQKEMTTAWDLSTLQSSTNFNINTQVADPTSIEFNNDGTKMFVFDQTSRAIYEYTLSTAYDVTTASYNNVSLSTTEDTLPKGGMISSDGSKIYMVGNQNDTIYQYSTVLTTASLDLSTGAVFDYTPTSDVQVTVSNPAASGTVSQATLLLTGAEATGVSSAFSTTLYTGTNATQTITNGIDLSGEGGLVWIKNRDYSPSNHLLFDTERGAAKVLYSNATDAEASTTTYALQSFTSTGFTLGPNGYQGNRASTSHASWTFRKAPKFFDIVTYTGTGSAQTISHNLGSKPGAIFVKCYDNSVGWAVQHQSLTATDRLILEQTYATSDDNTYWNDTEPTDTTFTVGSTIRTNSNGYNYVAYLFAHDTDASGVIKCSSYTGTSATNNAITLGWEPQWLMIKRVDAVEDWLMFDVVRGMGASSTARLVANTSSAEDYPSTIVVPTSTGFNLISSHESVNSSSGTYIYIAIRNPYIPTITYDTDLEWSGGTAPTAPALGETDVITVSTRDGGTTYQAIQAIDGAK